APGVNSYKRYQSGSFAPTRIVAGWDNRTCGFRLCGDGASFRVENRIPGADANAYLAFAATIAAGLHGIASKLKAPKPYDGNAYQDATLPQVPKTLREAIGELEKSRVARAAFGDRVIEHYLHAARLEHQAFDQAVTDWELIRNFERIGNERKLRATVGPSCEPRRVSGAAAEGEATLRETRRACVNRPARARRRLEGKVAFITGAGAGMGREAAVLFAEEGARVVVADIDGAAGAETVKKVEAGGGQALAVTGDVALEADVQRMIGDGVTRFGALHVLYNNAGVLWKDRDRS